MHGNVWQWCRDWRAAYDLHNRSDPERMDAAKDRVMRAGAFFSFAGNCRAANRGGAQPGFRDCNVGFRVALRLD
jgi:formylglycine-generating enzyme required for sulfatase activity